MVQLRLPVVALVKRLVTRGSSGRPGQVVAQGLLEVGASHNGVDMSADLAWVHDGVASLDSERCTVDGKELALGGREEGSQEGNALGKGRRHGRGA